jgi:hypothetical protein
MGKLAMDSRNGDSVIEGLDRFAVGLMQSCSAIGVKELQKGVREARPVVAYSG